MTDTGRTMLEQLQAMVRGEAPPPPVAKLVGFDLIEIAPARAVFRLEVGERHYNPMGTLHGGIVCDIADAALGCAVASTLAADESYTTLELSVNFLKPVWKTTLTATAQVVKRTRQTGVSTVEVKDAKGSIVAYGKCTCLVLRGEDATGR